MPSVSVGSAETRVERGTMRLLQNSDVQTETEPAEPALLLAADPGGLAGGETTYARVHTRSRTGVMGLVLSLLVVGAIAAMGERWTDTAAGSWYSALERPDWTPPGWVFGLAWTVLYAMMATAAWLVSRRGMRRGDVLAALGIYAAQLVLNLGWTFLFFRQQLPGWALLDIIALDLLVVVMIGSFWAVRRAAAVLVLPYAAWLAFATALNVWIVFNN